MYIKRRRRFLYDYLQLKRRNKSDIESGCIQQRGGCVAKQNYVLYAKWQKVQAPGKAKLTAASNSKSKKIAVKYKKVKNVDGYEISYAMNKKFKKASSITASKTKATISKLKKGKTYYVRVCAYNLDSTGQKVRGKWSSAKKVTVKK